LCCNLKAADENVTMYMDIRENRTYKGGRDLMEKRVEMVFSNEILSEGAALFQVETDSLTKIGDFENYIFSGKRGGLEVILRYTHSSHRPYELLFAESDWVAFLKRNGANVYEQFASVSGLYIERKNAADGTEFYIACYEKLPGSQISWRDIEKDQGLVRKWGEAIGKLHKITKAYQAPDEREARPHWDDEELFEIERFKPDVDAKTIAYRDEIVMAISRLPKTSDTYGLIHSDLHSGNFHVYERQLYLFDFDDCAYHWFASDIAIPLYYIVFQRDFHEQEGRTEFAQQFFRNFLEGYKKETNLPDGTIESIPFFLKLRDLVLLSVLYKKFDFSQVTDSEKKFFDAVKARVDQQEAIFDVNQISFP
jgi:amicoumacin kinase